jgi:hypothetical protein
LRNLWWLIAFVAAVSVMWWAGLKGLALLVAILCGLAGFAYFFVGRQRASMRPEQSGEDMRDVERESPPLS